MKNGNNENSVLQLTLSRLVKDSIAKTASEKTDPGSYFVELTAKIKGTLIKGEPYEMTTPNKIPWQTLAALALSEIPKDNRNELLDSFVSAIDNPQELKELSEEIKNTVEKKLEKIKGLTKITASGRVTADVAIELINSVIVKNT